MQSLYDPLCDVVDAVRVVQFAQASKKRVPDDLEGKQFFGAKDFWQYHESEHPNMCEECREHNLTVFTGDLLRTQFPYLEIIDVDFIYPRVHPHCHCALTRLTPLALPLEDQPYTALGIEVDIKVQLETPLNRDSLAPKSIERILNLSDNDFLPALESMLYVGFITQQLFKQLKKLRTKNMIN